MSVAQSETTRENTCVAEIKREKKNCTVTDSNTVRHVFYFLFLFFQKWQEND